MAEQPRKELLVKTAGRLFNQHGFHATGIDLILSESGVSKATLYKHFRTKEALILEVLERRHQEFDELIQTALDRYFLKNAKKPKWEGILVVLDIYNDWFNADDFYGCYFINASAEFSDPNEPINQYACEHKNYIKGIVQSLLVDLPTSKRSQVAEQILMLLDGAIVNAYVRRNKSSISNAKKAVKAILSHS